MGCGSSKAVQVLQHTATDLEDEVEKARLAIEVRKKSRAKSAHHAMPV